MKRRYLTLGDFSNDTQIYILGVVIARLTMRLLRAGIDPESVLTQKAPSPEEKRRMQETIRLDPCIPPISRCDPIIVKADCHLRAFQ